MQTDPELLRLLEAHFDGRLSDAEREILTHRLRTDRQARRAYWEMAHWHNALTTWGSQQGGIESAREQTHGDTCRGGRVIRFPHWARVALAAAACLALVAVFAWRGTKTDVAQVTYSVATAWKGRAIDVGQGLRAGDYILERGVARFETRGGGAIVTIAAPAQFRLISAERIDLHHGRLTARMLREDATLTVQTAGLDVTDLGTAFGVDTGKDGQTLVSVFNGAVAVSDKSRQGSELMLTEGQSVVGQAGRGRELKRTDFAPEAFADLWPLTVGINEASRLVEFLPPGPLLRSLREYQADDRLFLFPEQQRIVTDRSLEIDLNADSPSWPDWDTSPYPLSLGQSVSSYLVFFQPSPANEGSGWRRLRGEITFQNRVVGVICSDRALEASDATLGIARADYSTPGQRRGLEESDKESYGSGALPHDSIRILPDGRTVQFDFYVAGEREQMRIIISTP